MKSFVRKTFFLINLILAFLLIISSLSVYINPIKAWPFAFFGLVYPFLLLANIAFVIFWMILRKRNFLLSLIVILLTWNQLVKFIQIDFRNKNAPEELVFARILSYNVRLFNYYQWLHKKTIPDDIFRFIRGEKADIICMQEFLAVNNTNLSLSAIKKNLPNNPYSHVNYSHKASKNRGLGVATFSKFPIIGKGSINFGDSPNAVIFSDIKTKTDTIRIYNCHLQSTKLRTDDYNLIDSILFNYDAKHITGVKNLTGRLRSAYKERARQADELAAHIKRSPYPVIVCGDFNDTPVSYTYYRIKKSLNLKDAYLESGKGLGNTYFGHFPHFRIDYIFHDAKFKTNNFQSKSVKYSDHYPIGCNLAKPPDN